MFLNQAAANWAVQVYENPTRIECGFDALEFDVDSRLIEHMELEGTHAAVMEIASIIRECAVEDAEEEGKTAQVTLTDSELGVVLNEAQEMGKFDEVDISNYAKKIQRQECPLSEAQKQWIKDNEKGLDKDVN